MDVPKKMKDQLFCVLGAERGRETKKLKEEKEKNKR
jgi:hypothetical protein